METQPDTNMNIKDYVWVRSVIRLGWLSFLVQLRLKSNVGVSSARNLMKI